MIDTIRLNHTVWYSYEKKIIRINISDMLPTPISSYSYTISGQIEYPGLVKVHSISKDIQFFGDFNPLLLYAPMFGSSEETKKDDWNSRVDLKWEEQHKSFDIVLPPHKDFDVDGEMAVTIYYSVYNGTEEGYTENSSSIMNSQRELKVVIPFRSHDNPIKNPDNLLYGANAYTNVAIRNDKTNIIGTLDQPVVYECELVTRDVSDENPTYRDVLDMIKIEGRKDVELELDNDTLTVKVGGLMSSVNLAKYRDENTNNTLNVEDLKRDILSIVDGKLPNVETIKQEILDDVNPRIPDKETLKSEILAAVPSPSTTPYELTPIKMTKSMHDGDSQSGEFIDYIINKISLDGNLLFIKNNDNYEIRYRFLNYPGEVMHHDDTYIPLMTIPFSKLREITGGSNTFDFNNLDQMLTVLSSATNGVLDSLASYILNGRDFQLVKNGGDLTFKWRDTGGNDHNLLQFRYEDVVDKQVITTFIHEETKDFYTKQEVDQMIQQLRQELTANTRTEEHPQQ